jgi:hypothetical protein
MKFVITLCILLAEQIIPAHADALWDFYFGPDAVRCDAIGTTPEQAVAIAHRLPIGSDKGGRLTRYFAAHPEYADEIAEYREFYRTHCRAE